MNDANKSSDFAAEKATDPLLNPVASFGGEGEKDALSTPGRYQGMDSIPDLDLLMLLCTIP